MAEDDFVRPDRHTDVADRCLADAIAVDEDFGPRSRVDGHRAARPFESHRGALAGEELYGTPFAIAEGIVDAFEVLPRGREHDAFDIAVADDAAVPDALQPAV